MDKQLGYNTYFSKEFGEKKILINYVPIFFHFILTVTCLDMVSIILFFLLKYGSQEVETVQNYFYYISTQQF